MGNYARPRMSLVTNLVMATMVWSKCVSLSWTLPRSRRPYLLSVQVVKRWSSSSSSDIPEMRAARDSANDHDHDDDDDDKVFEDFIYHRRWDDANEFWRRVIRTDPSRWPAFVTAGDDTVPSKYRTNQLQSLFEAGDRGEFHSKDTRYLKRKTLAMQIGYVGDQFHGFQQQRNVLSHKPRTITPNDAPMPDLAPESPEPAPARFEQGRVELPTVERALRTGLGGLTPFAAGRTDRGVHAVSQIVHFATTDPAVTPQTCLQALRSLPEHRAGILQVYDCVRAPKSFHARSSATWRRYLYLVPLQPQPTHAEASSFSSFSSSSLATESSMRYIRNSLELLCGEERAFAEFSKRGSIPKKSTATVPDVMEEDDIPRRCVDPSPRTPSKEDRCTLLHTDAFVVQLSSGDVTRCIPPEVVAMDANDAYAICVEVVGNRFLHHMIRIMVGTLMREAFYFARRFPDAQQAAAAMADETRTLLKIVEGTSSTSSRMRASRPLPPHGLCFAGVGYDYHQLALYKYMPESLRMALSRERNNTT